MYSIKLLSPAGDLQKGKIAIDYGADSVYIGYPGFSLRATNTSLDEIKKLTEYAHERGKTVIAALNIIPRNNDITRFKELISSIKYLGIDGVIISDIALIEITRKKYPDIHITVSTQANLTNYKTIKFYEKNFNINRVVLARELTIDEVKKIREKVSIELESFVHGAVCMAYSGRCLLSSFLTNKKLGMTHIKYADNYTRYSNLGECVQPCRFKFALVEENRKDIMFPIEEDSFGTYILSAKDLCLINRLKEMYDAGITTFKIEGRMKSIYYIANITRVYRKGLDLMIKGEKMPENYKNEVFNVSHRGYTEGFLFNEKEKTNVSYSGYITNYRFHALIKEKIEANSYKIEVFNSFTDDKEIEIIGPDMINIILRPGEYELYTSGKEKVKRVFHGNTEFFIKTSVPLKENYIIRIKK
ncbi:MAG TPA: U32 family peptidase C-terminal domain-containing protein [Spirochaetota bacterium]|nr:U32 family peptidase C-terminal domain-containing protein [Spirochaetota bacterium]HOM38360.1 U32 family peptidase C-terminal domain-containing protein [Spirochaetota bacterium]HPQ48422.1 U32 family peptidase C-terminal domain-containing protein [Spirochaetota bacterium]